MSAASPIAHRPLSLWLSEILLRACLAALVAGGGVLYAAEKPKTAPKSETPAKKPVTKPAAKPAPKTAAPTAKLDPETEKKTEAPPKDVTSSKADSRDMESHHNSEFHGPDPEEEAAEKAASAKRAATAATKSSSRDMAGWELLRFQERDYVTVASIHRFYRFNELKISGKAVWFVSPVLIMKGTVGSHDLLINNIKFVMSYPVVELNGKACVSRLDLCKLIDPVLRPSYIGKGSSFDTVIIDAGHGGHDSGAKGIYGYEKDYALKLAQTLKGILERQGLRVLMTRSNDTFLSLGARVAYANKVPNSIYVSLHFNAGGSHATGIETFALSPQGSSSVYGASTSDGHSFRGNQRDSENIALATAIHASVVSHFKLVDRGVKRARWHVLRGLERPGVLFEGGFVTNANDAKLIAAENFRTEMASTIAQAIMNYRKALQPGKPAPRR
jgi:N-acetylmuramoyl-L-alanine amidase